METKLFGKIMNKKTLFFTFLTGSSAFASYCYNQQFQFGPEFLNLKIQTHVHDVKIEGDKNLVGFRLAYEYRKPCSFYAGTDLLLTIKSHGFCVSRHLQHIESSDHPVGFANYDLRMGYTIGDYLSPFIGTGFYLLGTVEENRGFHEGWLYLSGGFRSLFSINELFSMGLNVKVTKAIVSAKEFKNHELKAITHPKPWGGEIGVPFVWSFNPERTWTFQLEPYWINLDFSGKQQGVGSKFLIGYQF